MNPTPLSQRNPYWSGMMLGQSSTTIGVAGCTITCIGMKFGLTPAQVNDMLIAVGGFAAHRDFPNEKNLVIWKKLEEAIPGVKFVYRHYTYNNDTVLNNLPCLVEVNGAPIGGLRHWVLYVGNQLLYDPWDGLVKPTSTYTPLSFVVLEGEYLSSGQKPEENTGTTPPTGNYYQGLDLDNKESIKVAIDTWKRVADGEYISLEAYNKLQEECNKQSIPDEMVKDLELYNQMKLLGYTTIDDITKASKAKDDINLALQKEVAIVRDRNSKLADMVREIEEEDHVTHELGRKAINEAKELKNTLVEVAKGVGADKITQKSIVGGIFRIQELANRFIRTLEDEQKKKKAPQPVSPSQEQKITTKPDVNWLLQLFQLAPGKNGGELA